MKYLKIIFSLSLLLAFGCTQETDVVEIQDQNNDLRAKLVEADFDFVEPRSGFPSLEDMGAAINAALADHGIELEKVEYLTENAAGNTVFFSDRGKKQLTSDYVPNDPRNNNGTDVPYIIDGTQLGTSSGLSPAQTFNAMTNVMNTWDAVTCSDGLNIPNLGTAPFDVGYVSNILGFGGTTGFFPGIIVHAGVLPGAFFDLLSPGGANSILGVTFTLTYIEDLDEDGRGDVAIKEIYYNDNFNWVDNPNDDIFTSGIDFETVALHETGHALSQQHFGKVHRTDANGKIHFSPAAVMNAGYTSANRNIAKTDKAGHCSNWGQWPNR